jgi:hypothetical protein
MRHVSRIPPFAPAAATGIDSFEPSGAEKIAAVILAKWIGLGYSNVEVWIDREKLEHASFGSPYVSVVRSNLVNGVPPRDGQRRDGRHLRVVKR